MDDLPPMLLGPTDARGHQLANICVARILTALAQEILDGTMRVNRAEMRGCHLEIDFWKK